eukprot:Skav213513  [mRNA]  locus=scaffold656:97120:97769:- [translate_table: standard]
MAFSFFFSFFSASTAFRFKLSASLFEGSNSKVFAASSCAALKLWRSNSACALRKVALTFLGSNCKAFVQSNLAASGSLFFSRAIALLFNNARANSLSASLSSTTPVLSSPPCPEQGMPPWSWPSSKSSDFGSYVMYSTPSS